MLFLQHTNRHYGLVNHNYIIEMKITSFAAVAAGVLIAVCGTACGNDDYDAKRKLSMYVPNNTDMVIVLDAKRLQNDIGIRREKDGTFSLPEGIDGLAGLFGRYYRDRLDLILLNPYIKAEDLVMTRTNRGATADELAVWSVTDAGDFVREVCKRANQTYTERDGWHCAGDAMGSIVARGHLAFAAVEAGRACSPEATIRLVERYEADAARTPLASWKTDHLCNGDGVVRCLSTAGDSFVTADNVFFYGDADDFFLCNLVVAEHEISCVMDACHPDGTPDKEAFGTASIVPALTATCGGPCQVALSMGDVSRSWSKIRAMLPPGTLSAIIPDEMHGSAVLGVGVKPGTDFKSMMSPDLSTVCLSLTVQTTARQAYDILENVKKTVPGVTSPQEGVATFALTVDEREIPAEDYWDEPRYEPIRADFRLSATPSGQLKLLVNCTEQSAGITAGTSAFQSGYSTVFFASLNRKNLPFTGIRLINDLDLTLTAGGSRAKITLATPDNGAGVVATIVALIS